MKLPKLHADFLTNPLAHRGLHGGKITENSRAAMLAAIDAGYGIELDLHMSRDGEAMVFHDYDLNRLTGISGPIRQKTAAELQNICLENGEPIPTLGEILTLINGRAPLLIELKDQDGALGPDVGILEKRTAELVNNYAGPVAVMCFNPHSVYALKKYAPNVTRGLVTARFSKENWLMVPQKRLDELAKVPDFSAAGCSFISHQFISLNTPRVAEIKAQNVPILCWTIHNAADGIASRAIADNITFEGYRP